MDCEFIGVVNMSGAWPDCYFGLLAGMGYVPRPPRAMPGRAINLKICPAG